LINSAYMARSRRPIFACTSRPIRAFSLSRDRGVVVERGFLGRLHAPRSATRIGRAGFRAAAGGLACGLAGAAQGFVGMARAGTGAHAGRNGRRSRC